MRFDKRILSIVVISLLVVSTLSIFLRAHAQGTAFLTGNISDGGVDTDIDGTFDFLEVGVEVNVTGSGMFWVEVSGLVDSAYDYIDVWDETFTYLDVGVQVVYLSLDGPTIYASGLNPVNVSSVYLYDEEYSDLGSFYDIPLSREYSYTEFDFPPASLTGTIYDVGVDTDSDGTFDYLEVGVEINVSTAGTFWVVVADLFDSAYDYIWVMDANSTYLDVGIQVVYLSLDGPSIYSSGLNPVSVSNIILHDEHLDLFDHLDDVPLSRVYSYTEFDSAFADIEAIFVVYPDSRVVMEGALNYTDMESPNTGASVYGVGVLKKSGILTMLSANFSFMIPPEEASQFPLNSSAFTLVSEYSSDLLTTTVSGSTILPPSNASEFPFNITDFTVMGTYAGNIIDGSITVDIWNGFPLDDIMIDFQGNNTYVHLNGSTTVIFGNYPDLELNATVLEQLLANLTNTIGGQGPNSLYNMTNGLLEFTMLNNVTTLHNGDATVDFEAKVEGDLIQTLVNMSGQPAFLYDVVNTTWYSVESGYFLLTYAHAFKEAGIDLVFTVNMTRLIESMIPIVPEMPEIPPEMVSFIESLLNTTYCTVESAQVSLDYEFGQATLTANATIQDFNAELNYIKSMFLTYNYSQPWAPQLQTLNETQIDLTDFRMSLNLTETTLEAELSGFAVMAPLDWINATSFQLERFFNITASEDEPPGARERLKVTVEGGSNATHTVTIFQPGTVPEPDMSAPGGMIWNNQSISELKDLVFQIGPPDDTLPVIGTPLQTPETPDDGEEVTITVNVTDADTGVRPDGVILSYRTDGGAWNNVTMSKATGDAYEGTIQGLPAGTQVEYMIIAYDYAGNEAVKDKAGNYYVYTVIPEFQNWQIILLTLLLIGIILVIIKRRGNITENSLTIDKLRARMKYITSSLSSFSKYIYDDTFAKDNQS